jgi:nuclear pore complex protein Nup54
MSLFGNNQNTSGGSSLFGGGANTSSNPNTNTGGSLFSRPSAPSSTDTSAPNPTTSAPTGASLFRTPQNTTTGSSLFSNANTTTGTAAPSLFSTTTNQNTTGSSLFGGNTNQPANPGTSLFGGANAHAHANTNTNTQQSVNPSTSLFGGSTTHTAPGASLFGGATDNASSTFAGGFQPVASQFPPGLSLAQQQELARTRLNQAGLNSTPNEKNVIQQAETLLAKWDPNSQGTLLQSYLYNAVSAAYAPFYYKEPHEDEASWEKALAEAPKLPEESGQRFVPVLVRGFFALGQRAEYQAKFVEAMRGRLHEMNNSLNAVMEAHQQRITVALEAARRKHAELAQRTLRLAVKCQVLRNRGYALDTAEETLRKQLLALQTHGFDPSFGGREEEIWARMVALRERANWLEKEGKALGLQVQQQEHDGEGGLPEEVLQKTKKILKEYELQLRNLGKELEDVRKEYAEWEEGQNVRGGGAGRR